MAAVSSRHGSHALIFCFLLFVLSFVSAEDFDLWSNSTYSMPELSLRDLPKGQCSSDQECWDKTCCSVSGWCGTGPDYCKAGICISNCDAASECGAGANPAGTTCPLNVCCGKWGYCGTTSDFCGDGCQSNCDQPGPTESGNGDVTKLVIGYWEGWSLTTRSCASRTIDDVPVGGLTHLNLAFGYIQPGTFEIYPMPRVGEQQLSEITNLKQKAPGLRIWISLGGWTFSDNDTDTQAVWADIAGSASNRGQFIRNLVTFMKEWGFDGVDLDWEYPGAPDRGGHDTDGDNYVLLLKDIRDYWDGQNTGWGLSFTAPTSYWYLRWFPIDQMVQYTDWINLMTYDLHGSWDSPEDYIGSFVYSHTNLTEIKDALNLLWRNAVPANKVNLGIGFYGRSYTLADPKCYKPGCSFSDPGVAGSCTGQGGILSYDEIETMKKIYQFDVMFDEDAATKYIAYNDDQWVSYDDAETLKMKVDFANQVGLNGLFVWAIDLDDREHTALNALIGDLNKFGQQNGVGTGWGTSNWTSATGNECNWTQCGVEECGAGYLNTGDTVYCGQKDKNTELRKRLCCPTNNAPDPKTCSWSIGGGSPTLGICSASCPSGTVPVANDDWPIIDGSDVHCMFGTAQYCCDVDKQSDTACGWVTDLCFKLDKSGNPYYDGSINIAPCPVGQKYVTNRRGHCSASKSEWEVFCCNSDIDTSSCYWSTGNPALSCGGADSCKTNWHNMGQDEEGDGGNKYCRYTFPQQQGVWQWNDAEVTYCCKASDLTISTINLPIPLDNLFPEEHDGFKMNDYGVDIDQTMGGKKAASNSQDPDQNAFGFYVIAGPDGEVTNMKKRSGSHWELYDCGSGRTEERRTVKAVCTTDGSLESNCMDIYKGFGVAGTIVEMPSGCGPGRYAVAVALEHTQNQALPHHLVKRGVSGRIYDFTFDYDFSPITKRADSKTLIRIDYSDDPGFWTKVVASKGEAKRIKREVQELHGGRYERWLEHTWDHEKRSLDSEELHKRWFSSDVAKWWNAFSTVDIEYEGVRHSVQDTYKATFVDQSVSCASETTSKSAYIKAYAVLDVDISVSAGVTFIGRLNDLSSWDQSHVWFRSSGDITATFVFDANGQLSFHSGQVELFGLANFGASFRVPGIVTIGPNLRVLAQLSGDASLHMLAEYKIPIKSWDYAQFYPPKDGEMPAEDTPDMVKGVADTSAEPSDLSKDDPYKWDITAQGQIVAHLIPKVTFGIEFDNDYLASATIDLGLDAYARLWGNASITSTSNFQMCYGLDGGAKLFAAAQAPNMFGQNYNLYFKLWDDEWDIIPAKCGP